MWKPGRNKDYARASQVRPDSTLQVADHSVETEKWTGTDGDTGINKIFINNYKTMKNDQ